MAYANPNVPPCNGGGTVIGGLDDNPSAGRYAFEIKGTLGSNTYNAHAVYDDALGGRVSGNIALSAGTNLPVPV